jgi:hypothetical protein
MIKSVRDKESQQFSQSWYIRNTSSTLPIQDKKRSNSFMKELNDIAGLGLSCMMWILRLKI